MKKHTSKSRMGAKMPKQRPRLRSKWTTWPRPQLPYFHPSGPLGDTWALKSQKTCSRHAILWKVFKMYLFEACKIIRSYQIGLVFFQMGGFPLRYIYIYINIYRYTFFHRAPIWVFPICCVAGNAQASASQSTRSLATRLLYLTVGHNALTSKY